MTFTTANVLPSGKPTITGTAQVGQTLTVNTSGIMDDNGISRSFSYTWWKDLNYGPNAGIPQQISGATRSTYTIRQADARAKIKVRSAIEMMMVLIMYWKCFDRRSDTSR